MLTEWITAFAQLGFPVGVAVYLLIFQSKQLERFTNAQTEVRIGLYLILSNLGLLEEYDKQIKELRVKKQEDKL